MAHSATSTHVVTLNGHRETCTIDTFEATCEALIAKYGPGVPQVRPIALAGALVTQPAAPAAAPAASVASPASTGDRLADKRQATGAAAVDAAGKARATGDHATMARVGFAVDRRYFEDGTVLFGIGVANMQREKLAHGDLPLAPDAFAGLASTVKAERRKDATIDVRAIRLDSCGRVELPHPSKVGTFVPLRAADHAVQALLARAGIPLYTALQGALATGSRDVVGSVATTFATWQAHAATADAAKHAESQRGKRGRARKAYAPRNVVIGVRDSDAGEREIFRVVSEKYTDLPVDRIATALQRACPSDARCRLDYDGKGLKADIEFFTDVEPENAVVGEVWKAVARISTDDTGGGSIRGDGGVFMALCRNFTYTSAWQSVFALRHMGDVDKLVEAFRAGFADVMATIRPFVAAWGRAAHDDVIATVRAENPEAETIPVSELMAGIFAAQIGNGRDLVPVPGKRPERVRQLLAAAQGDRSAAGLQHAGTLTRAGLANAFTRLAHTSDLSPAAQTDVERAASGLLVPRPGRVALPKIEWMPAASI